MSTPHRKPSTLLLNLIVPRINPLMTTARVSVIHAAAGAAIAVGGKLLDLTIDLSAAVPHDCPPVGHFRLIARDRVWLRRLDAAAGDERPAGASLALFTTDPDEPLEGPPARQLRMATVAIVPPSVWDEGGW
jgi:hypothetical protein